MAELSLSNSKYFSNMRNLMLEEIDEVLKKIESLQDEVCELYEENSALWFRLEKLERKEDDLPGVSESRGCIKIIL